MKKSGKNNSIMKRRGGAGLPTCTLAGNQSKIISLAASGKELQEDNQQLHSKNFRNFIVSASRAFAVPLHVTAKYLYPIRCSDYHLVINQIGKTSTIRRIAVKNNVVNCSTSESDTLSTTS